MSLKGYCYINPLAHSYFETSIVPWMRENEFPELVKNNTTLAIDLLPLIQTRKDESERLFSHQSFCRQLFSDIHQRWRMLQRRNHFKSAKSIVSGEFTKMFRWCNQFSRTKDAGDASIQTPSLCLEKMTFFFYLLFKCKTVTRSEVLPYGRRLITYKETDTKVVIHALVFLQETQVHNTALSYEPRQEIPTLSFYVYPFFTMKRRE